MSDYPITSLPAAVAELGALPMPAGPVRLSPERLAEIKNLLRYESSISFHSARAKQSMLLLVAEVELLRSELEAARRPRTPRLCLCGHSHHAHTVPAPHSCFAYGQTCPCPQYRQLLPDEALAQLERNRQAAAEQARKDEEATS